MMKFLLLLLFSCSLFGDPARHEIVSDETLIYYLEVPSEGTYPLIIAVEGSYVDEVGPQSVLRLQNKLSDVFVNAGFALLTMERRGIDGTKVDPASFHLFNTPSQRLKDHLQLVNHLRENPPPNWNGKLVILGGSEGGPITIKLSHQVNPSACVVLVGCDDLTFKEYIWTTIQTLNTDPDAELPSDRAAYEAQVEIMKNDPDPQKIWFGQTYLYWSDALDQSSYHEFLDLKCPAFVVTGSKDIECAATDRLIEKARQKNQNVTYLRVEGMEHNALDPKWNVLEHIQNFLRDNTL